MPKKRKQKSSPFGRYLEIAIIVAAVIVVIFVASFAVKVTKGVTRTVEAPQYQVRLQVLNGCGKVGLAARMADELDSYRDEQMQIRVVDTDDFESRPVHESFIISREEDRTAARLLAGRLGLNESEVIYKAIENNYRQVSVTLVLGNDFESIRLPSEEIKE